MEKEKFLELVKNTFPLTQPEFKILKKCIFITDKYIQINCFSKAYIKNSIFFEKLNSEQIQIKKDFLSLLKAMLKEKYPDKDIFCIYKEKIKNEKENS